MFPAKGEELFISNRQNGKRLYRKRFLYPQKNAGHFLPSVRVYTTHGSSTRRGSFCGGLFVAYCALLAQGDQFGERLWMYAWYHFADVKNSKLFLLDFVPSRAANPQGWYAQR